MARKIILLGASLSNSLLLVLMICLGSQNLSDRHNINLGFSSTESYPTGFLVGISIALGSLSGGLTASLITTSRNKEY
ncbi:hypothetical protein EV10_0592 [Prochlorococcus marinus str. SS51]|nr:hypothetical protein EV10_0592 [Prochlorococcus marinus str. SS51]